MGLNLAHLAAHGRAYSAVRPWTAEELEAVSALGTERNVDRITAANYVRNGVESVEAYDKAVKKEFVPKTMDEAYKEAEEALNERGSKVLSIKPSKPEVAKKKK